MSTKIYNGLLIDSANSLVDLRVDLIRLSNDVLIPAAQLEASKMCARLVCETLDNEAFYNEGNEDYIRPSFEKTARESWIKIKNRIEKIKQTSSRDPMVDFSTAITLFPLKYKTLAIPFCVNPTLSKIISSRPCFKAFPYWNNTDKPDEITEQLWKARGKLWDEALGNGIPAQNGFTIDLIPEGYVPTLDIEDIKKHIPSMEERIQTLMNAQLNKSIDDQCQIENPVFSISVYNKFVSDLKNSSAYELQKTKLTESITTLLSTYSIIDELTPASTIKP